MAFTNHEKIRKYASLQKEFIRQPFLSEPNGSASVFYVDSDSNYKIVPYFDTGNTIAGISDVEVFVGLSGVQGMSQLTVTSVDPVIGSITISGAVSTGTSLVVTFASSPVSSKDIEQFRLQAESMLNQRLSLCYDLPLSATVSQLDSLSHRLAAALLMIRGYGVASRNTSQDGWRLYTQLVGDGEGLLNTGTDSEVANIGEVGLICRGGYQLIGDDGSIIPRNDDTAVADTSYVPGGKTRGRLHRIVDEPFIYKDFDGRKVEPGTGVYGSNY